MDTAYDRIQAEALPAEATASDPRSQSNNLNTELQQAYRAVSASPWAATLGGWFNQARKQGESLVQDLQKEASEASEQATKGFSSLRESVISRTGALSLGGGPGANADVAATTTEGGEKDGSVPDVTATSPSGDALSTADIVKEAGSLVASLRSTAAAKLKDLQRAEDAADEALLKFGLNVRNFLRDAVVITAPGDDHFGRKRGVDAFGNEVLFETKDASGRKIFHSTRLDAQLHAIHSSKSGFTVDPSGSEWKEWESKFNVDEQTAAITADLEKYEELKRAFEWSVPERADYKNFWMRYYFLRKAVDEEERRRKEVLKGAAADTEEEVGWDDDEEEEKANEEHKEDEEKAFKLGHKASESTTTLNANATATPELLKPNEPRRSEDEKRSVAGSDASYDMMVASGTMSRATSSPKQEGSKKNDDDDDDDWE